MLLCRAPFCRTITDPSHLPELLELEVLHVLHERQITWLSLGNRVMSQMRPQRLCLCEMRYCSPPFLCFCDHPMQLDI